MGTDTASHYRNLSRYPDYEKSKFEKASGLFSRSIKDPYGKSRPLPFDSSTHQMLKRKILEEHFIDDTLMPYMKVDITISARLNDK